MGLAKSNRDGDRDARAARSKGGSGTRGGAGGAGFNGTAKINGTLRFEFQSNFDTGCEVQQIILAEVERHGFNPNSLFATRLALSQSPLARPAAASNNCGTGSQTRTSLPSLAVSRRWSHIIPPLSSAELRGRGTPWRWIRAFSPFLSGWHISRGSCGR